MTSSIRIIKSLPHLGKCADKIYGDKPDIFFWINEVLSYYNYLIQNRYSWGVYFVV